MKRHLIFIVCLLLMLTRGIVSAHPEFQETGTDAVEVTDAISTMLQFFSAGIDAAGSQLYSETEPEAEPEPVSLSPDSPDVPEEEPEIVTISLNPEPTTEAPVYSAPHVPEQQLLSAPEDPENYAVSTGISVSEFYNAFRTNVKNSGRHAVSFEEKGRKNASRITVDDNITIYLYYTKSGGASLIDRFSFEAMYRYDKEQADAGEMQSILLLTLSHYLRQDLDDNDLSNINETVFADGSLSIADLLIYGKTTETDAQTKLTVRIYCSGGGYVPEDTSSYNETAEDDFRDLVAWLKREGLVPETNGSFYFHNDYQMEWAQISWYQWDTFARAKNFAVIADITWASATSTPNFSQAGCGFVLRAQDSYNHLYASLNMDGRLYIGGARSGQSLNYGDFRYNNASTKGSAQMIVVANNSTLTVYVDGSPLFQRRDIADMSSDALGFLIMSGSNRDYGTRCNFDNVFYYVW